TFPNILLDNNFTSGINFMVTYDQLDKFLEIYNLEDLVAFYNDLFQNKIEKMRRMRLFELRKLAPGDIKLDDFGFNIKINKTIFNDFENPKIFPFNKTVYEVLANFPFPKHLYKNIANMTFEIPSEKEKDTWIPVSIPIKGNSSTILDQKNLENKEYPQ